MKKSYCKFIALGSLVILTLTYSCKKFLDKEPVQALSGATLANKAGLDGLLIGAYSMLDGYTNASIDDGQGLTQWETSIDNWSFSGLASDDAYKGSTTGDQGPDLPQIENHTVSTNNAYVYQKWMAFYDAVQRANDVIREVPLITDGSVTPAYGAEAIAEAKFLRGVFHFELAKIWKNVPYVDETITYTAGNYNVPNPGPIWDKIEADFTASMGTGGLPKGAAAQAGRANWYAAEAFLAKTYMYEQKYAAALPLLTDLVTNGKTASGAPYALGPYENNFNAGTKNGPESVFAAQMTTNDGSNGQNDGGADGLNTPGGSPQTTCCGFNQPSYNLANSFKTVNGLPMNGTSTVSVASFNSDGTSTTTSSATIPNFDVTNLANDHGLTAAQAFTPTTEAVDPRLDWTVGRRGIPYLDWGICGGETWTRGDLCPYNPIKGLFYAAAVKTTADSYAGWAANQGTAVNYNIIRFSEIILWRAECYADAGNFASAEQDVNMVRNRMAQHPEYWVHTYADNSNPQGGYTSTPAANYQISPYSGQFSAMTKAQVQAAISLEEELEFGMEGHRFFDLARKDGVYVGAAGGAMANTLNNYIKADTRISNPVLNGHTFTQGRDEIYPIPLNEITLSQGKLKQNPLYP